MIKVFAPIIPLSSKLNITLLVAILKNQVSLELNMKPFFHGIIVIFLSALLFSNAQADTFRVNADTLKHTIQTHQQHAILLDTRSSEDYQQGHIPGALNFPIDWTYEHKDTDGKITKPNRMQQILRRLGLGIDTPVIVYDDGHLVDAARLFWVLEVYGLHQVKILNTGYDYWIAQGYPTSKIEPSVNASHYIAEVDHNRLATKFSTLIATKSPNQVIIDARPNPAYEGEVSSAERYGHIPKAINIPASHNLKRDHKIAHLQPVDKLKQIYGSIPKNKKVIIYCAIGRISAANYLALRELGYEVSNYDASWKEWSNDFSLPVVNPSKR